MQRVWKDPATGCLRRHLSPAVPSPIELAEVRLPPGAHLASDGPPRAAGLLQQIWMLNGGLDVAVGGVTHRLERGDCLAIRVEHSTVVSNPSADRPARYLLALAAALC